MQTLTKTPTYLTTAADGDVWLMPPGEAPRSLGLRPTRLDRADALAGIRRARVVARPHNNTLVVALAALGARLDFTLELGTPYIAQSAPDVDASYELWEAQAVGDFNIPSRGGWQPFDPRTLAIYAGAALPPEHQSDAYADLRRGGLWRRLSFALPESGGPASPGRRAAAEDALCRIICAVRDPRWFVDPGGQRPDRPARLYTRLGLGRRSSRGALDNLRDVLTICTPPADATRDDYRRPGNFLWRLHAERFEPPEGAPRSAGKAFARFLREAWLDWLYEPVPWVAEPLFVPNYFFGELFGSARTAQYGFEVAAAYCRRVGRD